MPEMVFGDSALFLLHVESGIKIHFNAFDALMGWKQEALPPVEVPAAAKWKFRRYDASLFFFNDQTSVTCYWSVCKKF